MNNDLISKSALQAVFERECIGECGCCKYIKHDPEGCALIDEAPMVDAEPVRHGRWIPQDNTRTKFMCSDCKSRNHDGSGKWCSACGCKMDGGTHES